MLIKGITLKKVKLEMYISLPTGLPTRSGHCPDEKYDAASGYDLDSSISATEPGLIVVEVHFQERSLMLHFPWCKTCRTYGPSRDEDTLSRPSVNP